MSKIIKFCRGFLLLFLTIALETNAQITINRSDFPRQAGFIDTAYISFQTKVPVPSEGAEQIWDYSTITKDLESINTFTSAQGDVNFPNSLNYYSNNLTFQNIIIPNDSYEELDDDGWFVPGMVNAKSLNSLNSMTGKRTDSLNFPASVTLFSGRINIIQFPMTFMDSWTQSSNYNTNFILTLSLYGANHVPGYQTKITTNERTVTGFGKLILPDGKGNSSKPIDVLQLKVVTTIVDSMFLAGKPAPDPILEAFGLTQGNMTSKTNYFFFAKNFGAPVFQTDFESGVMTKMVFRPAAINPTSVNEISYSNLNCHPNPAIKGDKVYLTLKSNTNNAQFIHLFNIDGQTIVKEQINIEDEFNKSFSLPENITPGTYLYEVLDDDSDSLFTGKLIVIE